jgi:hypothetical protein
MASLFQAAKDAARKVALAEIPKFIENYEPQMEESLSAALREMKAHPEEAATFLLNWNKLDGVVRRELQPEIGGRKKRKNSLKKTKRSKK